MRLALLTDDWQPTGGVASYLRLVAPALARAGHDVLVLHAGQDAASDTPPGVTVRGILGAFRDYGPTANAAAARVVSGVLREFGADVAHVHANDNLPLGGAVCALLPAVKTIHTLDLCPAGSKFHFASGHICTYVTGAMCLPRQVYLRCTLSKRPHVIWRRQQRTVNANAQLRQYRAVVTASQYVRRLAIENGVPADRLSVIPYYTTAPANVSASHGHSVLFVGRITPEKGLELLLDAVTRVTGNWHLNVVGDGIGMAQARARVEAMQLSHRVTFHGWLRDEALAAAYQEAAVVVVPSRWPEPFGIVGIEAMALSRPVVAFGVGGIPDWLTDGEGGFLIAPESVAQLASGISRILDDPGRAAAIAARGRARVMREFSESAHLEQLLPLYERVRDLGR